ncbi:MAG TPA: YetF domain-containing protein [Steroidobacteraceae bacterium]|nr:YetF domain-containing protein [Steroidobacteraceae bacterium]
MTTTDAYDVAVQAAKALGYYATLLVMMRLAGKRLAGQTTTFDLLVLITLGVTVQGVYVGDGTRDLVVFVVVVFAVHRGLAAVCRASPLVRHLVRGKPRALVLDGVVIDAALDAEGVSRDELLAGLRRLGFEQPAEVRLAVLEETGHISAIALEDKGDRG